MIATTRRLPWTVTALVFLVASVAAAEDTAPAKRPLSAQPYTPSLDVTSMDRSVDPCVDFFHYSCGGWNKKNPIPPDQARWDVYGKLTDDNAQFLWGMLEDAARPAPGRDAVTQKIVALQAWRASIANKRLAPVEGLTPEQRFFVGFAQWAGGDERPESKRLNAITNPHSPLEYRIKGVGVNLPDFAAAFSCREGQPMVKPADKVCRVW